MSNYHLKAGIIQINVTDLKVAWQFYVETLGLPGKQSLGPNRPFEIDIGSDGPTILIYPVPQQAQRNYPDATGITLVFHTDNIQATVADWKAKGVTFIPIKWAKDESGLGDTPFGPFIAFQDPFGNVHELLEPAKPTTVQIANETATPIANAEASNVATLKDVFAGFPQHLVPESTREMLLRYALGLDTLGRLDATTFDPLVDEHTLRRFLRECVDDPLSDRLVHLLATLPAAALRSTHDAGPLLKETPFFGLAHQVNIFDTSPSVTFAELMVSAHATTVEIMQAVRDRFPSLENELVDPEQIPRRIEALIAEPGAIDMMLSVIYRQLGWWAAFVAVLLVPPTIMLRDEATSGADSSVVRNAWPLSMYLLASMIGGWTLTVVGNCILAPIDLKEAHGQT